MPLFKKKKAKGGGGSVETISSGNHRANTAQAGSVVLAVGKITKYISPFLTTFLIKSSILNLFSEMQCLRFFLHILSKD